MVLSIMRELFLFLIILVGNYLKKRNINARNKCYDDLTMELLKMQSVPELLFTDCTSTIIAISVKNWWPPYY